MGDRIEQVSALRLAWSEHFFGLHLAEVSDFGRFILGCFGADCSARGPRTASGTPQNLPIAAGQVLAFRILSCLFFVEREQRSSVT